MISIFNGQRYSLDDSNHKPHVYINLDVDFRDYVHHFRGARLAVFIAIALHINEHGWAWPSIPYLARKTGYTEETVRQAIKDLSSLKIRGRRVLLRTRSPQALLDIRTHDPKAPIPDPTSDHYARNKGKFMNNFYRLFPTPEQLALYEERESPPEAIAGDQPSQRKPSTPVLGQASPGESAESAAPSPKNPGLVKPPPKNRGMVAPSPTLPGAAQPDSVQPHLATPDPAEWGLNNNQLEPKPFGTNTTEKQQQQTTSLDAQAVSTVLPSVVAAAPGQALTRDQLSDLALGIDQVLVPVRAENDDNEIPQQFRVTPIADLVHDYLQRIAPRSLASGIPIARLLAQDGRHEAYYSVEHVLGLGGDHWSDEEEQRLDLQDRLEQERIRHFERLGAFTLEEALARYYSRQLITRLLPPDAGDHERQRIEAWLLYARQAKGLRNPGGFLRNMIESSEWPPERDAGQAQRR